MLRKMCLLSQLTCMLLVWATVAVPAQCATVTLEESVTLALEHYPAVRAAEAMTQVSAAGVDLSRTSYLPRAELLWQMNRATRNNILGTLMPQPVVSGISGPVGVDGTPSVWNSATGLLVAWEPFDFGLRAANVESAESALRRASASANLTRLQVATAAADAFLTVVAAELTRRAAEAAVVRARIFHEVVVARVNAGLRPGVDAQRARAELAVAETQRIAVETNDRIARIVLAQYTGLEADTVNVNPGPLVSIQESPPAGSGPAMGLGTLVSPAAPYAVEAHPQALEQDAAVHEARAQLRGLERTYSPRFNILFSTFARGTGWLSNDEVQSGLGALRPDVSNWAIGLNVTFPLLDWPAVQARKSAGRSRQVAETARYSKVVEDLEAQMGRAQAFLDGAQRTAANTPIQLEAARATEQQATARYQSGLSSIVEVADAQRLLTQAEIDDAIAKLNIWRGLLLQASVQGDIEPFLRRVRP